MLISKTPKQLPKMHAVNEHPHPTWCPSIKHLSLTLQCCGKKINKNTIGRPMTGKLMLQLWQCCRKFSVKLVMCEQFPLCYRVDSWMRSICVELSVYSPQSWHHFFDHLYPSSLIPPELLLCCGSQSFLSNCWFFWNITEWNYAHTIIFSHNKSFFSPRCYIFSH